MTTVEHRSGAPFESILFERSPDASLADEGEPPDFLGDLNLDQVLAAITADRRRYELEPFFFAPLRDVAAVRYRHDVLRDLEEPAVHAAVTRFADTMSRVRQHLATMRERRHPLQRQAWFVDAIELYCDAVRSLAEDLADAAPASAGFRGLRRYLQAHTASAGFRSLTVDARAVKQGLAGVRYAIRIDGSRVTVGHDEGEPDYGKEIEETFARFKQAAAKTYLVKLPDHAEMDHVEAQILERVARLNPEVFEQLAECCARHSDFVDTTIGRFDREVQFLLGYLELVERLRAAGLPFCYPDVSAVDKDEAVEDTFDLALASKLAGDGNPIVCNDYELDTPERVFVVSGPNNGGKTTFARTFGQLHHLAALGLLVPGARARIFLPDRIYTHFEREEDIETLRGKFDDELVRVRDILDEATSDSVIVMNESFSSTTLHDALLVGTEVMRRILELGALGVYVTFVDEIASLSEATVSLVSQIVPEDPAERTFKLIRKPADGLAYAWAIADKYGLTYERLTERLAA
jgi:DNA mismatch repair protein MutS